MTETIPFNAVESDALGAPASFLALCDAVLEITHSNERLSG
jgi:hypothetical protein